MRLKKFYRIPKSMSVFFLLSASCSMEGCAGWGAIWRAEISPDSLIVKQDDAGLGPGFISTGCSSMCVQGTTGQDCVKETVARKAECEGSENEQK